MGNPFQGRQARLTGNQSQLKSVKYILSKPDKYGIVYSEFSEWLGEKGGKQREPTTEYIFNRLGDGSIKYLKDLFSTTYDFETKINKEGKKYQKPLRAGFDIICIPNQDTMNIGFPSYLIQVKTNYNVKNIDNQLYMQALKEIKVPPYFKKELHIWYTKDSSNIPDILNLDY